MTLNDSSSISGNTTGGFGGILDEGGTVTITGCATITGNTGEPRESPQ